MAEKDHIRRTIWKNKRREGEQKDHIRRTIWKNKRAYSSINSAPELLEDGASAVYCEATTTASSSKIFDIGSESHPDILSGCRLMDVNILDGIFNCLACPECYDVETLHLNDTNAKKKGLAR